jgi:hypothetical protein
MLDAEDLPKRWQRWTAEAAGAVAIVVLLFPIWWSAQHLKPALPWLLGKLTALLH